MRNIFLLLIFLLLQNTIIGQTTCPTNLSFDANNLSFWEFKNGRYSGSYNGTYNNTTINSIPSKISTVTSANDIFANNTFTIFKANADGSLVYDEKITDLPKVPVINGYKYNNSVRIGSSSTGGSADKLTFRIDVPANATAYNLTYAYAAILQDVAHGENEQPAFVATVTDLSINSKIECASKRYYSNTSMPIMNGARYEPWREVSIDLSQYAGKTIELKFEAFDCQPSGHYGYAYLAFRNDGCGTGTITGNNLVCTTSTSLTYSTPSVDGASYTWTLPVGWTGSSTTNTITVNPNGNPGGNITVTPSQSCGNITTRSLVVSNVSNAPATPSMVQGNTTVCAGSSNLTYFVPEVTGASSYTWTYPTGWTIVSGLNTNKITFNANSTPGNVTVSADNLCGSSSTSTAAVSITNDPLSLAGTITGVPGSIQCPNYFTANTINLTLGSSTGSIQKWLSSTDGGVVWTDIANNNSVLNIIPTSSTLYKAVVKNGTVCVEDESDPVLVNVYSPIQILNQPVSVNTCANVAKTFTVSASGDGTLNYKWQVSSNNGSSWTDITASTANYSGYNTSSLTVSAANVTTSNNGLKYRCIVSSSVLCSPVTSAEATMLVSSTGSTVITTQPLSQTFCVGSVSNISVVASGPSLTYQWQEATTLTGTYSNISGATKASLSISTTTAGTKYYKCVITESCGTFSVTSDVATIDVSSSSVVSLSISSPSTTICAGSNKIFNATPTNGGTSPIYAWYKNGSVISGQTAASYATTDLVNGDNVYATVISNQACAIGNPASSNTITTSVNTLPVINATTGPNSVTVGSTIILTNASPSGIWASSNSSIASVINGTVTGVSVGNANILYSITDNQTPACTNTSIKSIAVNDIAPIGLSYITPNVYIKGTVITALNPTVSGGAVTNYSISPALPSGLTINETTGVISGTSTVISPATDYTVTASNSGGSVTAVINISVIDIAPNGLSYTTPNVYIKGTSITALNPTVSGGAVSNYSISPALPSGLTINATSGIISGTPNAISSATDYTVTASNSGGSVTAILSIEVILPEPQASISAIDYGLLAADTVKLKMTISNGVSPFKLILNNSVNDKKDTIENLIPINNEVVFKLKTLDTTKVFTIFKLIDANNNTRTSGFTKDTTIVNLLSPKILLTLKADPAQRQEDNSFKTRLLLKIKNDGDLDLKNVQVNANLSNVFPSGINYKLDSVRVLAGNFAINPSYTGAGTATAASSSSFLSFVSNKSSIRSMAVLDENYLFNNGVTLNKSAEGEIAYYISIGATTQNVVLKLQFESAGDGVLVKNDGSTSAEETNSVSDDGTNFDQHPDLTKSGSPMPTYVPLFPNEKIGASLNVSSATTVSGGYQFHFTAKVKNYGNVNLDSLRITYDFSKIFPSPDQAILVSNPTITRGNIVYNLTNYDGYNNVNLFNYGGDLQVGDSATYEYDLKVTTNRSTYTWPNYFVAYGRSINSGVFVKDTSMAGTNPDPNNDNDPAEQFYTYATINFTPPAPPTVENKIYTYGTTTPPSLSSLVKSTPTGTIPVWCDLKTAACSIIPPPMPTEIGKYIYALRSYDTTTLLYSEVLVYDTVIIKPPVPIVVNKKYIIGLSTNPANIANQVKGMTGSTLNYFKIAVLQNTIPTLGTTPGVTRYTTSQTVNGIESDTVGFTVTMLDPKTMLHLRKIADEPKLQTNSTFNIAYTFIVTNRTDEAMTNVLVADNLQNTFPSPTMFDVVSVSSTGGLVFNNLYNGKTDIQLLKATSSLAAAAIDTIKLTVNLQPKGYAGTVNNVAVISATTPYGTFNMNSSSQAYATETAKLPTPAVIPDLTIDIPEAFSPNRDGVNDRFVILKPFGTTLELEVYNRWGNVVYYNANYNNEWDGRGTNNFIGQELMDGGYYYTLKAKSANGNNQIFKGFVLIQR